MRTDLDRYRISHGKLTTNLTIPVDLRFKDLADQAKAHQFDFNAWARDVLKSRIQEVVEFCELKQTLPE